MTSEATPPTSHYRYQPAWADPRAVSEPLASGQQQNYSCIAAGSMGNKSTSHADNPAWFDREGCEETAVKMGASFQTAMQKPWYAVTGYSAEWITVVDDLSQFYPISDIFHSKMIQPETNHRGNFGILSADKILLGYIGLCRGYLGYQKASQQNDGWGMLYGKINVIRGVCKIVSGATAIPFNALCMAATQTTVKVDTLSRVILKGIGLSLSTLNKGLLLFLIAVELTKGAQLSLEIDKCMASDDPKIRMSLAMRCILGKIDLNTAERAEIARFAVQDLGQTGQHPITWVAEDQKLLTDCDRKYARDIALKMCSVEGACDGIALEHIERHIQQKFILEKKRKKAEFGRRVGDDALQLVLNEMGKLKEEQLLHRLHHEVDGASIKEAQLLVDTIREQVRFDCLLKAIAATFFLLGTVGTCLSLFGTGGIIGVIGAIIAMITSLGGLAFDLRALVQAQKSSASSVQDKVMLSLFILLATASATLEGVFSSTLIPFMASSVIFWLWGSSALYQSDTILHSNSEGAIVADEAIADGEICKVQKNRVA